MLRTRFLLSGLIWVAILAILAACGGGEPQVIEKVVTKEVVKEVKVTEEVVVTKEVEKIVEVTPTAGRCAPNSFEELGDQPIKIGVPVPLSAPGSVTGGRAMQTAVNIAVDEVNAAGGILGKYPVDVVFYDTSGLPERGRSGAEYLITQECVVGITGEYHSAAGVQIKDISHKYGVPTIFAETWNDQITAAQYPEVFRIAPASSMVAEADAQYLQDLGVSWVAIVAENTDYGVPASEATQERLAKR
ncbi:hypothetical protein D6833_00290, partial [Candidatus Parcubacteria bacterium]